MVKQSDRHDDDGHGYGHGHGMAEDLPRFEALIARRRALQWFAGLGTAALVSGCGGSNTDDTVAGIGGTAAATSTPTPTTTTTITTSSGTCVAAALETNGPYPADGTNTSSGSTSNVLTTSGIVRGDIRSSFIGTTTVATGVALTLTLTVVNVNASCAPLAGYAVYIWCCDRQGLYSLYTVSAESYLRGVQVTDANGQCSFTLIFPGCYPGRWPHIHFEVYSSLTNATSGRYATLVSQLAMPTADCTAVYADTTTYPSSAQNFTQLGSLANDNVFGDNTTAQNAAMTPALTGSVSAGYAATATIGLAL